MLVFFSPLLLLLSMFCANPAWSQGLNKEKITASYLYNFAKNIEWPNQKAMTSFDIAVYGTSSSALMNELAVLQDKVKLRNLPITVNQVDQVDALVNYHLVYVEEVSAKILADIYENIDGKPVLLVTDSYNNKQLVMINLITTEDGRLKFEVNKSNIINHDLTPLPELILNGGTEIDVAKLYREGQASLIALQKQLRGREKTLKRLAEAIKTQELATANLQAQMAELNVNIKKSDALIAEQKALLLDQQKHIETSRQEREALLREVELRTKELDEQQKHLRTILQEIDLRENASLI